VAERPDTHYYPLLKAKAGELAALTTMDVSKRASITPLFDVPPEKVTITRDDGGEVIQIQTVAEALEGCAAKLVAGWRKVDHCLVDLAGFDPSNRLPGSVHPVTAFFADARRVCLGAIPVTGPDRDHAQVAAVAAVCQTWRLGAAVRLRGAVLGEPEQISRRLTVLLDALDLEPAQVDLLIDLGEITARGAVPAEERAKAVLAALPGPQEWRALVLCGGAYPARLGNFVEREQTKPLPRRDWALWRSVCDAGSSRLPAFGDYGIAAPDWGDPFDPNISISAKIVYTSPEDWMIAKGRKIKKREDSQYYELARRLVKESGAFRGERHCRACRRIAEAARHIGRPGNPTTWIGLGTRHHLKVTSAELASLA
jgi:Beta protein